MTVPPWIGPKFIARGGSSRLFNYVGTPVALCRTFGHLGARYGVDVKHQVLLAMACDDTLLAGEG